MLLPKPSSYSSPAHLATAAAAPLQHGTVTQSVGMQWMALQRMESPKNELYAIRLHKHESFILAAGLLWQSWPADCMDPRTGQDPLYMNLN